MKKLALALFLLAPSLSIAQVDYLRNLGNFDDAHEPACTSAKKGMWYYNTTNNYLKCCEGSSPAWNPCGSFGSGAAGRCAYWSSATALTSDTGCLYDGTTDTLTIAGNVTTPIVKAADSAGSDVTGVTLALKAGNSTGIGTAVVEFSAPVPAVSGSTVNPSVPVMDIDYSAVFPNDTATTAYATTVGSPWYTDADPSTAARIDIMRTGNVPLVVYQTTSTSTVSVARAQDTGIFGSLVPHTVTDVSKYYDFLQDPAVNSGKPVFLSIDSSDRLVVVSCTDTDATGHDVCYASTTQPTGITVPAGQRGPVALALSDTNRLMLAWTETSTISGSAATVSYPGSVWTLTGLSGMSSAVVGGLIEISGAANPTNNTVFTISGYNSSSSVTVTNVVDVDSSSGAGLPALPEANNGSLHWRIGTTKFAYCTPTNLSTGPVGCTASSPATIAYANPTSMSMVVTTKAAVGEIPLISWADGHAHSVLRLCSGIGNQCTSEDLTGTTKVLMANGGIAYHNPSVGKAIKANGVMYFSSHFFWTSSGNALCGSNGLSFGFVCTSTQCDATAQLLSESAQNRTDVGGAIASRTHGQWFKRYSGGGIGWWGGHSRSLPHCDWQYNPGPEATRLLLCQDFSCSSSIAYDLTSVSPNNVGWIYGQGAVAYAYEKPNGDVTLISLNNSNQAYFIDVGLGTLTPVGKTLGKITNKFANAYILGSTETGSVNITGGGGGLGVLRLGRIALEPMNGLTGQMYFNTGTSTFRCYNGTSWSDCNLSTFDLLIGGNAYTGPVAVGTMTGYAYPAALRSNGVDRITVNPDGGVTVAGFSTGSVLSTSTGHLYVGAGGGSDVTGTVQTTNASQTTLASITLANNSAYWLEADVVGRAATGVLADGGPQTRDHVMLVVRALVYKENGGSATIEGTVDQFFRSGSSATGWDATFTVSGSDVRLSVTGEVPRRINWAGTIRSQSAL